MIATEELEGGLFVNIWVFSKSGVHFAQKNYYTVINGLVFELNDGAISPTGDSIGDLALSCTRQGMYNPSKKYIRKTTQFSFLELKRALKL